MRFCGNIFDWVKLANKHYRDLTSNYVYNYFDKFSTSDLYNKFWGWSALEAATFEKEKHYDK